MLSNKVYKKWIFVWILLLSSQQALYGQKITTFQRSYGGTNDDFGASVLRLPNNDFLISSATLSYGSGGNDILLIRTDSLGKIKWSKTYGGGADDADAEIFLNKTADMVLTPDSNVVICSNTKSYGKGGEDVFLFKIDLNGNLKWSRTFGGASDDFAGSIINDPNRGFIIVGETKSFGSGNGDVLLIKTDTAGQLIWAKSYGIAANEEGGTGISVTQSGNFIISGFSHSSANDYDQLAMKIDKSGNLIWAKVYGTLYLDEASNIKEFSDKTLYMSGLTYNLFNGANTVATMTKLDSTGKLLWTKMYDKNSHSGFAVIAPDAVRKVLNVSVAVFIGNSQRLGFVRMDTSGAMKFCKTYGPISSTQNYSAGVGHTIIPLPSKGFALLEATHVFGYGGWDNFFLKLDSDANPGACFVTPVTLSPLDYTSSMANHSYAFTTTSISPSVGTGMAIKTVIVGDSLICAPFATNFNWQSPCAGQTTIFYDSSYYKPTHWSWNFGDPSSGILNTSVIQNPGHVYKNAGTYIVKLVSGNGTLNDSITKTITISTPPTHLKSVTKTICLGDSVNLNPTGTKGTTFAWNNGKYLNDSTKQSTWAWPIQNTTFVVNVGNVGGCTDLDTFIVKMDTSSTCPKLTGIAGVVNSYVQVKAISSTCSPSLTVPSSVGFAKNDLVIIMQMKGATIDSSKSSSFGTILSYNNAGNYEFDSVLSVTPTTIQLKNSLIRNYDVNKIVQLIRVPVYTNATITGTLTCSAWDGIVGGVLALEVKNLLIFKNNIDVRNLGFQGGLMSYRNNFAYGNAQWFEPRSDDSSGNKGEGISTTDRNLKYQAAKGPMGSGGGGGDGQQNGGGGGSNAGAGGVGGGQVSFNATAPVYNGGLGGKALSYSNSVGKIFLGGGGGGGQENFNGTVSGGNGGGIVIINSKTLYGNGFAIKADGQKPADAIHDGGSGGGAGGAVLIAVPSANINAVNITANGGNGANNVYDSAAQCHAPGGGGGGGVIWFKDNTLPSNVSTSVLNGVAGLVTYNKDPCYNTTYGATNGFPGEVLNGLNIPQSLPINLNVPNDTTICLGNSLQLKASGNAISYSWSPGASLSDSTKANPIATPLKTTSYILTAKFATGCIKIDTIKVTVVPKPLTPVIINTSIVDYSDISVTFTDSFASFINGYTVLMSVDGGAYKNILNFGVTVNKNKYTITNPSLFTNLHSYSFKVVSADQCSHVSDTSIFHIPVLLTSTLGNLKSILKWKPYVGYTADSVLVQRFLLNGGGLKWTKIAKLTKVDSNYTDASYMNCNSPVYYRIATYGNGQVSYSDTLKLNPSDTVLPKTVNIISASVINGSKIGLQFAKVAKGNTKKYLIYVKKDHGAFVLVDSVLAKNLISSPYTYNYNINSLTDTFSFRIYAIDSCGNQSLATETHRSMQLTGKALDDSSQLYWSPYIGFSVKNYTIQTWTKKTGWADTYTGFKSTDSAFKAPGSCKDTFYYRVKAIENGGDNAITYSDSIAITPFDTISPARVNLISASVTDGGHIKLLFNKVADVDVTSYSIYRKKNGGTYTLAATITRPLLSPVSYTDILNTLTDTFSYRVFATDSCGNTSKTTETHRDIQLNGKAADYANRLQWDNYKGFTVKNYIVQQDIGGVWTDYKTLTATDSVYVDTLIPCKIARIYRVKAIENGGDNATVFSDSISLTPFDTIKPKAPVITYVTATSNTSTQINWTPSASNDVKNYIIYRQNALGAWVKIDSVGNVTTYNDLKANAKQTYCYAVAAKDSCAGNVGALSAPHCTVALNTSVKGCEKAIYLVWNKYAGWPVAGYEIVRSVNGGSPVVLNTVLSTTTTYKDSLLDYHNEYCYAIVAIDLSNPAIMSISDSSCNYTFFVDTPRVLTATKISTSLTNGMVVIRWKSIKTPHLAYNQLYYSANGNTFTLLKNNIPPTQDTFAHTGLNTETADQYYYLITVDSCGTSSNQSSTNKTMNLTVSVGQLLHKLNWTPYKGFKIKYYYVQKLVSGKFLVIDSVPSGDTATKYFPAPCNSVERYRIVATGFNKGEISWSDTMGRQAIDTVPSNRAIISNSTILSSTSARIDFRGSDSLDTYDYVIARSIDGVWGTAGNVLFNGPGKNLSYTDNAVNTQKNHLCYTVIVRDSCLNATPTDTFCDIQLIGKAKNLSDSLKWFKYKGYGITNYFLLRYLGPNKWDTLAIETNKDTGYFHAPLPCNVPVTYKVEGLEKTGGRITFSDSVTLAPFDTIKPPAPVIKYATVLSGSQIQLFWHKSISKVKLYELSLKTAKGPWTVVDTVKTDSQFVFKKLDTPDSTYSFRIVAIDSCAANRSPNSIFHSPVQLGGDSLDDTVKLSWKPYEGFTSVKKYYIYVYRGGWKLLDSVAGNVTTYFDKPLACNVTRFYRIGALDNTGKYLSYSDTIKLTPYDTIKPPAPLLYYASVQSDNSISLGWHWNQKSDVKYFDIYRSKNGSIPQYIKTIIYDSVYTDIGVTPKTDTFSYYVIATDSCNTKNRSKPSHADTIMNLQLKSFACTPQINISWSAYKGLPNQPDSYEVYRSSTGSPFTKIISLKAPATKYTDNSVNTGTIYYYKIRAVDSKSGYGSYSDSMGLEPSIVPLPDTLHFVYATIIKTGIADGQVYLQWKRANPNDTNAKGYHIYAYDSAGKTYNLVFDDQNLNDTSYTQIGINTQNKMSRYYVTAYNRCVIDGINSTINQPVKLMVNNQNLVANINWTKYQGIGVKGYLLYKSNDGGVPYIINASGASDSTYTDTNIYCHHLYTYQVQALLTNNQNSYSDSVTIKAFDTTPPAKAPLTKVSVVRTSTTIGEVQIFFAGNKDKNRAGYDIYRATSTGNFNLIYSLFDTSKLNLKWIDGINMNTVDSTYRYYVRAIDSCGNASKIADTQQVIHLKAKAFNKYIQLNWTAYKGWQNWTYLVYKQYKSGAWYNVISFPNSTLSFSDSNVTCHQFYNYMVLAINTNTGDTSYSNISGDSAINTVPPEVEPIQRATVIKTGITTGKVNISWNPSPAKNIEYYNIYRSTDGTNWTEVINLTPNLNLTDSDLNTYNQSYYYKEEPVDSCGNIGNFSITHQTLKLKAKAGNQQNDLTWNAYQGWKIKNYMVLRNGKIIASLANNSLAYIDTLVLCDSIYQYQVRAICDTTTDTLFSASNTDSAKSFDHIPPQRVYLKSVSVSTPNKEATITWLPSPSWDVKNYYVYRKSAIDGTLKFIDSTDQTSYTDNSQEIKDPDCYYVFARDHCGNQSPGSNYGCLIILNGKNYDGYNQINWNPYDKWPDGISSYNVYKNEDGQGWNMIGTTPTGAIDNYLDGNLGDTTTNFCYQVEAVETNGLYNATSRSTVECLHQNATVFIPNSFTHYNLDGLNDNFGPKGLHIKNYTMKIYNRWGELLYNTDNSGQWDCTYKGEEVPQGIYVYYIVVEDYNKNFTRFKGNITIFR